MSPVPLRFVAVGLVFAFASLGSAQKYMGTATAVVLLAAGPLIGVAIAVVLSLAQSRVGGRAADLLALTVCALAIVALVVVYPHANTHVPGHGSDRDDAANLGARGFLHLRNPYGEVTYLGNPISPLPGLLLLAVPPVVLAGSSAWGLVVWLPLLYLLWRAISGDARVALGLLLVALASPAFLREYLTGGDLITNAVVVAGSVWLVHRFAGRVRADVPAALVLGVALSSRLNYLLVLVPLVVAVARREGARTALRVTALSVATFAALTVPFAVTAGGREALRASNKLSDVPGGAPAVVVLAVALALVLALRERNLTVTRLFGQAAAVQTVFLVGLVLNSSVESGRLDFFWLISSYGVSPLLLALTALARPQAIAVRAPALGGRLALGRTQRL